jgi:hypothetical protein
VSPNEFNFEKLFRNAHKFIKGPVQHPSLETNLPKHSKRDIHYPKGSIVARIHRSSSIIGNNHMIQELFSKKLGIKK